MLRRGLIFDSYYAPYEVWLANRRRQKKLMESVRGMHYAASEEIGNLTEKLWCRGVVCGVSCYTGNYSQRTCNPNQYWEITSH